MSSPLISVVMSVYNGEKHLKEAIDSILIQTFTDFEFIIVDDGSQDNSAEIIKSYGDLRIIFIQQENKGLSNALNMGISVSRGKFIARMDADDTSIPERLSMQVDFLQKNTEYVVCGTFPNFIDDEGNYLYRTNLPVDDHDLKNCLPLTCPFVHTSVMIDALYLKSVGGYKNCGRYFYQEDLLLWIDLSISGKFKNIASHLVNYRISPSSNSQRSHLYEVYQMDIVRNYFDTGILDYSKIDQIHKNWGEVSTNVKMSDYHERIGVIYLSENLNISLARHHLIKALSYHPSNYKAWGNLLLTFLPAPLIIEARKKYLKVRYNMEIQKNVH